MLGPSRHGVISTSLVAEDELGSPLRGLRRSIPDRLWFHRFWIEAVVLFVILSACGMLAYPMGAPRWLAVLCAALGIAAAVATAALARRGRVTWVAPTPTAHSVARESAPAATDERMQLRRALGYVCVPRHANGSALAAYSQAIKGCCAERGLTLVRVVHDVELEPRDARARPALDWALERIAAGDAETLVVAKLRHLSSTVANLPPLLRWFGEPDRRLVAIDVLLDTATEHGRRLAYALVGVGGWERERLSARTRRGLEAARSRGRARGRAAVVDVPELQARIARMREQGMTLQAIADALNAEGVPTLRGGAKWRPSSLQRATGYRRPTAQRGVDLPGSSSPRQSGV